MTALSADANRRWKSGDILAVPMDGAAQTIYKGSLVCRDASGYGVSGADTASFVFAGVASEQKVISATETDGTTKVKCYRRGLHRFAFDGGDAAETDVGSEVCIVDDNTVELADATTNDIPCGKIRSRESASVVWVDIEGYC